jgi:hypothetical protein
MLVPVPIFIKIDVKVNLDINKLIDQLKKSKPVVPEDLNINVSDETKVSDSILVTVSKLELTGSLSMIKSTNNPTEKELDVIRAARGDRPYSSIFDVRVSYNEKGNITSISWSEN